MNKNTKRIQVWINEATHDKLVNDFLKDDSNRVLGAKIKKGGAVELGLKLLFESRKHKSLEDIYMSCNGGDSL